MLAYDLTERPGSFATVVLSHPHPDMGGNRFHPVVDALYGGLALSTLRYDFTSSVMAVARAELGEAIELAPGPDVVLAGYSFGANVSLSVDDPRVRGWLLVAPPLPFLEAGDDRAGGDPRPKLVLVPERDQYCSPDFASKAIATWAATSLEVLPGADHFLAGREHLVLDMAARWLAGLAPVAPGG